MFNDRKYFCDRKSAFQAFFVIEKVLFKLFCDRKSAFQAFLWSLFCSDSQISHLRQIKSRRNSEKGNHAQTTYLKTFWSSHMKGIAHSVLYNLWTLRRRLIVCNTVSFHGKSCDSTVTGSHLTVTFGNPRPIPFPEERDECIRSLYEYIRWPWPTRQSTSLPRITKLEWKSTPKINPIVITCGRWVHRGSLRSICPLKIWPPLYYDHSIEVVKFLVDKKVVTNPCGWVTITETVTKIKTSGSSFHIA